MPRQLWLLGMSLVFAACECVQLPDASFACESDLQCLGDEHCVEGRCTPRTDGGSASADSGTTDGGASDSGVLDGGALDGGVLDGGALDGGPLDGGPGDAGLADAGATDAGTADAGSASSCWDGGSAGFEGSCTDGIDNDGDGFTDCADCDCANVLCRASAHVCDAFERCAAGVCPPDALLAENTPCNDQNVCTIDDRCSAQGQCVGVGGSGNEVRHCGLTNIEVLLEATDCSGPASACGAALLDEAIALSVPDAGPVLYQVWSLFPSMPCLGDWMLSNTTVPGYTATNTVTFNASPTPFDGGVPVYQYESSGTATPYHRFGTSPTPPNGYALQPAQPLFHACPR